MFGEKMNRLVFVLIGFLLISIGVLTAVYIIVNKSNSDYRFEEKLNEAEELLKQSKKRSASQALLIYTEILSKEVPENLKFRAKFGHAIALQKNKDKLRALEIYKELNQTFNLSKEDKEKLSYQLGNLLLVLNQEEEGKAHLDFVLQTTKNNELKSKTFQSIADNFYRNSKIEQASKNYLLSIQEYPNNLHSRVGLMKTIRSLGRGIDLIGDYQELDKPLIHQVPKIKETIKEKSISFEKAKTLYNKKEYKKAIHAFNSVLKNAKDGITKERAYYYIAESNYRLGNYDKSLGYAEKVLVNEPTNLDKYAYFLKGLSYYSQKNYEKAAASFNIVSDKYENSNLSENAKAYSIESLKLLKDEVNDPKKESKEAKESTKPTKQEEEDFEEEIAP